jgi:hypothetical protein
MLDDAASDLEPPCSGGRDCLGGPHFRHRASAEPCGMADRDCGRVHHRFRVDRSVLEYETGLLHSAADTAGVFRDRSVCDGLRDLLQADSSPALAGQAILRREHDFDASEGAERRDVRDGVRAGDGVDAGDLRELLRLERLLRRYRDDANDEREGGEGGGEACRQERGLKVGSAGRADEGEVRKVDRQGPGRCREVDRLSLSCESMARIVVG